MVSTSRTDPLKNRTLHFEPGFGGSLKNILLPKIVYDSFGICSISFKYMNKLFSNSISEPGFFFKSITSVTPLTVCVNVNLVLDPLKYTEISSNDINCPTKNPLNLSVNVSFIVILNSLNDVPMFGFVVKPTTDNTSPTLYPIPGSSILN